jgi:hypothetical protein
MSGPYAAVGARLVERGYAAIPVMPGTKRPGHMRGGEWIGMTDWREKYTKRPPSQFEIDIWSRTDAGVCVVCGPGSRGLVAIDIDSEDELVVAALDAVLPATPVAKRGAKGETRFYLCPDIEEWNGTPSPSFNLPTAEGKKYRACDVIGPGRQTVLPPTIHPDTHAPYRWLDAALEDFDPDELPRLDPDIGAQIAEALKPFGYEAEPRHAPLAVGGTSFADKPHRQLNETALGNLDAWVPKLQLYRCKRTHAGFEAVPTWRSSNTGRPIERRKLNLKIDPKGIRDFGDDKGYTPIDLVIASQGCDLDTAVTFLAGCVGWAPLEVITIGRKEKPATDISHLKTIEVREVEEDDGPVKGDPIAASFTPDFDELPGETKDAFSHLTNVPGIVGDLIDWIAGTARRPNRTLAMAAAIPVVGTLIGRRVATPTRSGTHIYCAALAPTGAGKQHPINCLIRAMHAAKASHHLGPSEFISMSAFVNTILRTPLALCPQDEFGAFLSRVNGRNASGFEAGISKALRMAWGASFEAFLTPEYASRKSEAVRSPAISILGMSTHEEFYTSLQGRDVTNGFLNRFLVLSTGRTDEVKSTALPAGVVPDKLKEDLQALYNWSGTQLGTARLNDIGLDADPDIIHWAADNVRDAYYDLSRHIEAEMDARPEVEPFIARTAEIALRLATIRAAGRLGHGATLALADMEWGRDIALASAEIMAGDAAKHMVQEMSHGQLANKLLAVLQRRGKITRREAMRSIGNGVKRRDFDEAMNSLAESGQIEIEKITPNAGGTSSLWLSIAA